jgi:subtilisin family serine protease
MRPHFGIQLRTGIAVAAVPHWTEILGDKQRAAETLHPEIDRVLLRHGVPVWVTAEYEPAGQSWSDAEAQAGLNRRYRVILQRGSRIPSGLLDEIALLPVVESVRPGHVAVTELPAPRAEALGARTGQRARDAIGLESAHRYSRGDPGVKVAVLDTGICLTHPELRGKLLKGRDFVDIIDGQGEFVGDFLGMDEVPEDEVGHGTHVAGIIAGEGIGMPSGVAPKCKVLPIRVLGAMQQGNRRVGAGLVDNINAGVKWAVDQGADVVNMSLGVEHAGGGLPHEEVIDYARRKGVTIVAASGNDGREALYYPGALPSVIAVGAEDDDGDVAAFSTYGSQVSFVAPGTDIYSSHLENDYAFSSGTSHAAPFVTGAVLLLKSFARARGRKLSDGQAKNVLKHTADKLGRAFKHEKAGFGRLNLADAMRLLEQRLN